MKRRHLITLLFIRLIFTEFVLATNIINYNYTILPSNDIYIPTANCIYKEQNKYVWVGTNNGIYRFDGYEYKRYNIFEKDTIRNHSINNLFTDKYNRLWFLSNKSIGQYDINKDKFLIKEFDQMELNNLNFYTYSKNEDGIYFGCNDCILKYDYKSEKIEIFHKFKTKHNLLIKFINIINNDIIILSNQEKVYKFNKKLNTLEENFIKLPSKASCFYRDNNKNTWIATYNNGLKCFNSDGVIIKDFNMNNSKLSSDAILCIAEQDSTMWMGTDGGGINILNLKNDSINILEHIPGHVNSLPSNSIKSIFIDDYKTIWAGSVRDGIINIQKGLMNTFREVNLFNPYGLSNPSVLFLYQEKDSHELWIGTDGEGLNKLNLNNKTFTHYPSTFKTKITSIATYSDKELLLSLYLKGFYLFNKENEELKRINIDNDEINNKVFFTETSVNLLNENEEDILFITDNIYRYNVKSKQIKKIKIEDPEKHYGYFLHIGKKDNTLYFFDNRSIYALESNGDFLSRIYYTKKEIIKTVSIEKENTLWVATNNGLKTINIKDSSSNTIISNSLTNISSIISDVNGNIWIGNENTLIAYLVKDKSFATFGHSQGAINNEYLKKSNILTNDGSVFMGGAKGLLYIDKNFKIETTETPMIEITELKVDGLSKVIDKTGNITLPWDSKSIEISVMSLEKDILRPKNYRFEIISSKPIVFETSKPILQLNSLLPGENTLYVSCSTRKGIWTKPVELLKINILPPWYKTWWFVIGVAFILFTIIILIFYSALRKKDNAIKIAIKEHEKNIYEEKVRFLININHELRTPITLIHSPLKRIIQTMNSHDKNFIELKNIYRQSDRMKRLLNMVLDLRKMEMGVNILHLGKYNLNAWIQDIVNDFISEGNAIGIKFETSVDTNIGEVSFDKEKMEIVLTNLIVNAIKHSTNNSTIFIESKFVSINNKIMISVIDQGEGLKDIDTNKLFTRFYQGSNEKNGTGIGLSYSKTLIELHNGNIGAMNNPNGKGATFFFTFPSELEMTDLECESKPYLNEFLTSEDYTSNNTEEINKYSTNEDTLLFVDDNDELRKFIEDSLKDQFKKIITASNGNEAIELIKQYIPNIIISDIMMPHLDGYKLCEIIKEDPNLNHIPVILLTARDEEESKKNGYKLGADTYLTKPFDLEVLLEVVKGLLNNRNIIKQHYINLSAIPNLGNIKLKSSDEIFIQKLNSLIIENISNTELDINFICKEIGMSRASFYNKLKSVTDISGNEYINNIRLEHAIELIKSTNLSFTEISDLSGFTSPKYFSTLFKQYKGQTPTEFKKMNNYNKTNNR